MWYLWPGRCAQRSIHDVNAARLAELLGEWRRDGPAGDRLAATVRALVLDGRVPLQTQMPAERALAASLGLSRATVTRAYERLRSEGYLASRQGSGSWVTIPGGHRAATDTPVMDGALDLRIAALPAPAGLDELAAVAAARLPRWFDHHGYDPLGLPPLREAIAARFTARGLPTTADQILVTNGALQALDLSIRALLTPGRTVLTEIPSYPAALDALHAARARIRTVPVTADGWNLDVLEGVASEHKPDLAYLIPDFHNPTGVLMNADARQRATRALSASGTYLVIDESFVELGLDGVRELPMASLGHDPRTITIGSLGKSVWGGLRIGWARASAALVQRLAVVRARIDLASPVLEQLLAVEVFAHLEEMVADRCRLIRPRLAALMAALDKQLPQWKYPQPAGGLCLWVQLPDRQSTSLAVRALEHGVALTPGPRFGAAGLLERYLRIPYSSAPDQLERVVSTLAQISPETSEPANSPEPALRYVA